MNGIFGSWFASNLRLREEGSVDFHGSPVLGYAKVIHVMSSNVITGKDTGDRNFFFSQKHLSLKLSGLFFPGTTSGGGKEASSYLWRRFDGGSLEVHCGCAHGRQLHAWQQLVQLLLSLFVHLQVVGRTTAATST